MSLTEALGGFGKVWESLEGFGRLWQALGGFGMRQKAFERLWEGFGRL